MAFEQRKFESREAARLARILDVPPDNVPATLIEHIDLVVDQLRFLLKLTLERSDLPEIPDHVLDSVADLVVGHAVDSVARKREELVALGARYTAEDLDQARLFEPYSEELFDLLWDDEPDRD